MIQAMKLYKYAITLAVAVSAAAMVSCDDDLDRPPVIVPVATYEVNTSVETFKQMFWDVAQANSMTTIPVNEKGDSIIIGGRVISSDASGNVYQRIYLRDESGAMDIRIYAYDIHESYPVGQEVRINVTGLLVGGYGKQMQIGAPYNNGIGGMDESEFKKRAQRNGLPHTDEVEPYIVTLDELASWTNDTQKLAQWQCQLVKIENVSFEDGGVKRWCDKPGEVHTTTRYLKDASGKSIDVRTSDKCTFASQVLPKGTGSVIAILGSYNNKWQLSVMDPQTACIDGFEFVDAPETPDTPAPDGAIFAETFQSGIGGFTIDNVNAPAAVPEVWKYDSKYKYMIATAYVSSDKSNHASDSWLISPVIDLAGKTSAYLSFDQALNFFESMDVAKTQATVNVREAGASSWTALTVPSYPASMSWDFASSGSIDLSAYAGKKIEIGFHYTSTAEKAGTWEVKNVVVTPEATSSPEVPTPPAGGFSETFANGIGVFTIENVVMNEPLDYVWNHDSKYACMKASAYVNNASQPSDSWLISPVIDLSSMTAPVLAFEQAINKFSSVESAKEQISVCVRLEGANEWTKLPLAEYGSNSSWNFFDSGDISLAAYAGKKVQIAFHYTSTSESSGTWEVKNVTVK